MSICITTVRAEGEFVQIVKDDRLVFELPWQAALDLAKAIHGKAKECEEFACRDTIIHDQAIVTRLGLRFGLTSNPHMLKEAAKEAAWNRDLRRYIRADRAMGIASQSVVGTPSVVQHKGGTR